MKNRLKQKSVAHHVAVVFCRRSAAETKLIEEALDDFRSLSRINYTPLVAFSLDQAAWANKQNHSQNPVLQRTTAGPAVHHINCMGKLHDHTVKLIFTPYYHHHHHLTSVISLSVSNKCPSFRSSSSVNSNYRSWQNLASSCPLRFCHNHCPPSTPPNTTIKWLAVATN